MNRRPILWTLLPCAVVLCLAAWLRGAEYDEQYTLFLTAGVPRPAWPVSVFPAGLAARIQAGHAGLASIARDLRITDVHPPLYFWLVSVWREVFGPGLFVARMLSVVMGLGGLALVGTIARLARVPPVWAMLMTLGCYGFTYTSAVARGFALAQLLLLAGVAMELYGRRWWHFGLAGVLFGAATLSNYLSVFAAGACLLCVLLWTCGTRTPPTGFAAASGWFRVVRRVAHMVHASGGAGAIPVPEVQPRMRADGSGWGDAVETAGDMTIVRPRKTDAVSLGRSAAGSASAEGPPDHRPAPLQAAAAIAGFLCFIPVDLWWFLAQRNSRPGQFPAFSLAQSLARLGTRFTGDILGGLPLYVTGIASAILAGALGLTMLGLIARIAMHWRDIGTPRTRHMFALAALAPPLGLLALGAIFNNTPIEVRYLTFSTPFVGLLLAGALGWRGATAMLAIQAVSIAGLMLAPATMQPARLAARAATELLDGDPDGVVLLPRGNDGVGVVGAFAIESPPALSLLLIPAGATPEQIRARIAPMRRVVLALSRQDEASRAASEAMGNALTTPGWREVARRDNVALYERD